MTTSPSGIDQDLRLLKSKLYVPRFRPGLCHARALGLLTTILTGLLLAYCHGPPNTEDLISSAAPSSPTNPTVYYVAVNQPGASDDNNGLYPTYHDGQDGPWLTIQHAANTMTAGDVTYVRAGTYYESGISFAHSGAPGAPITLANYGSEQVVIDGSQATDGDPGIWMLEGGGHYVIQGFTIRNMGWSGIATDEDTTEPFQDITIRDCIVHDNGCGRF